MNDANVFVNDGIREHRGSGYQALRERKLREIEAYLYGASEYKGWGTCEHGDTGFFFFVSEHAGFGPDQTLDRLASGLHFGHRFSPETVREARREASRG